MVESKLAPSAVEASNVDQIAGARHPRHDEWLAATGSLFRKGKQQADGVMPHGQWARYRDLFSGRAVPAQDLAAPRIAGIRGQYFDVLERFQ